ncbi:MAG: replicative DNA helicase, partial [Lachnospiraceae bacterium]|nr:replicative DNA helicase [Lachnospiraceae bacterium]
FYERQYGILFEAIVELSNEGKTPDTVTVTEKLKQKQAPQEIMNPVFLAELVNRVPTSASIRSYCEYVKNDSLKRKLIRVSEGIADEAYKGALTTDDLLSDTEKKIFDLVQTRGSSDIRNIDEVVMATLDHIQEVARSNDFITGIPSGFAELDYATAGFQKSNLILLAARPSMGKTAFALNIASNAVLRKEKKVMIFSLEMSDEDLMRRLISMDSGVDSKKIRTGKLMDSEWDKVINSAGRFARSGLTIDDTPAISVAEMRSKCRRRKLEKGLDMVMVDYLQLMSGTQSYSSASRQQEISDISRSLKALARELDCPVLALSQLSRAPEQRQDHRPMLSDLRESGAIEQDADLVMFIYRDEYYTKAESKKPGIAEIIIAKQRNGGLASIDLKWVAELTKFIGIDRSAAANQGAGDVYNAPAVSNERDDDDEYEYEDPEEYADGEGDF